MSEVIKAPVDFRAGKAITLFEGEVSVALRFNPPVTLDLSDTIYMDTVAFRMVFNWLPMVAKVIPPKSPYVICRYDDWLDSKKGLIK